jgi:glycosyltransferase involved in cell wall biosynthesis
VVVPEFSVIVPTYGRPAFLADAIASVLAQTFDDFECIVVDDATPGGQTTVATDPRVRLIERTANGGPAAARNTGIEAACGRYLAFLDDDDVWLPNRLAKARSAHERAPLVCCWQGTLGEPYDTVSGRLLEGDVADSVLDALTPHLGTTSVERTRAPRFDARYPAAEDVDWWLRAARELRVTTVPEVGFLYRSHAGPRAGTGSAERIVGMRRLLEEHASWFGTHPRAAAFRLKRMGLTALDAGDRRLARDCFARALRVQPEARTAWHLTRTFVPVRRGSGRHAHTHA